MSLPDPLKQIYIQTLEDIRSKLVTQDNAHTKYPMFAVQKLHWITGMDTDYTNEIFWYSHDLMDRITDPEEIERLEEAYFDNGSEPDYYTRTGAYPCWETKQIFFTRDAAQRFIDSHSKKDEMRIYVESAHNNVEWQAILARLQNKLA